MAKPRALILGGAGYFGARLALALTNSHQVFVTYRSSPPLRKAWLDHKNFECVHFDSATMSTIDFASPVDLLVNLAMPGARESAKDPDSALAMARTTAALCIDLLLEGRARRMIHLSTFHVYGSGGSETFVEDSPVKPLHPYGEIHLAIEHLLKHSACADDIYILRATNMVGAPAHLDLGAQASLVFLDLCRQAVCDKVMVLGNDGASFRDFLNVRDAIDAVLRLSGKVMSPHRLFNLAAGQAITLKVLAETISSCIPGRVEIVFGNATDTYRTDFRVDISRLTELAWNPKECLADAIKETLAMFE